MSNLHNEILHPRLQRAISELSENVDQGTDTTTKRKLIEFFRSTMAECGSYDRFANLPRAAFSDEFESVHYSRVAL